MQQPISACYSEAAKWRYFGEVDAQNKFLGRSFEIRPTGVAHAELIIPAKWADANSSYPTAGSEYEEGMVVEHYSWKKVTTNISNFIMGSPLIDHYGDLTVSKLLPHPNTVLSIDRSSKPPNRGNLHTHVQAKRMARERCVRDKRDRLQDQWAARVGHRRT